MGTPDPASMLEGILAGVGAPPAHGAVRFHGHDPVLPTPFRIGEFGAAAIAAAALQATRLAESPQRIDVDVDAAAAGMRSSRYLTVDPPLTDAHLRPARFRTRDGRWLLMQRLFPHHVARQLEVLGCRPDAGIEEIESAVGRWDALDLEAAILANGAVAGMVRSADEWGSHPQSEAIASLPLVEISRIGDAPPAALPSGPRLLSGLRVLDVTRVLAGPTCARTLAEHGAEVLRISSPRVPDDPHMLMDTGHGKRSTVLDLTTPSGRHALEELARDADVFSQGYRSGALTALGFGADQLAAIRPGIVAVSISAYGRRGPWSRHRGFDSIVQAVTGMSQEMAIDDVPRPQPANPLDYITGYLGAFGALVALARRAREGGSYHVEVSLARTGLELMRLPRVEPDVAFARPAELPAARLGQLMTSRSTPFGRLSYLAPIARLETTPGHWDAPSVPADHDPPEWLPRLETRSLRNVY